MPAPTKGVKAKGAKTAADRFANALQTAMNDMGADGWEYQRTDTLPCEERVGLTGRTTKFQNMLVFRRTIADVAETGETDTAAAATVENRVSKTLTADPVPTVAAKPLESDPAPAEPRVAAE